GRLLGEQQIEAVANTVERNANATMAYEALLFTGTVVAMLPRWGRVPAGIRNKLLIRYWPVTRFIAYSIPVRLFVKPIVYMVGAQNEARRFQADPRMRGWEIHIGRAIDERLADPNFNPQQE